MHSTVHWLPVLRLPPEFQWNFIYSYLGSLDCDTVINFPYMKMSIPNIDRLKFWTCIAIWEPHTHAFVTLYDICTSNGVFIWLESRPGTLHLSAWIRILLHNLVIAAILVDPTLNQVCWVANAKGKGCTYNDPIQVSFVTRFKHYITDRNPKGIVRQF